MDELDVRQEINTPMASRSSLCTVLLILTLGCERQSTKTPIVVLDQTRKLVANGVWDRGFDIIKPGTTRLRIEGEPPFRVFVTEDASYRSHMQKNLPMDDLTEGIHVRSPSTSRS